VARFGIARQGRHGGVSSGPVWCGKAWQAILI
jgi:hypothetical protein